MLRTTRVDFHCHSNLSDGYFAPDVLARKLAGAGVHYAALTDHDGLGGLARFQEAARARGMSVVPGVEISSCHDGREAHVLAYGFDAAHPSLKAVLGAHAPLEAVCDAVHAAGGKAFLAHPIHLDLEWDALDAALGDMKQLGLDGVEAFYKACTPAEQEHLAELAEKHGLLTTGGSDFHGPALAGARAPGVAMPSPHWKRFREALGAGLGDGERTVQRSGAERPAPPRNWGWFFLRIVLPALLVVAVFAVFLFAILIPTMEASLLERKREMIRELTNSAWSILAEYEKEVREGRMTRAEAQKSAIERIEFLRYGAEGKDYFWITDMHPRMIMHPYRKDLEGRELTDFRDPEGARLFVEFVRVVEAREHGHVDYVWQWKDEPQHLAAKQSYVRGFEPWGWIIGTGLYTEDVEREIHAVTRRVVRFSVLVGLVAGALLLVVAHQSLRIERRRRGAERDLRASHERYRALVEASSEGTLLVLDQRCTFANKTMLDMLGCTAEELAFLDVYDLLPADDPENPAAAAVKALLAGGEASEPFETSLKRKGGGAVDVVLYPTRVTFAGRQGVILNARDVDRRKAVEQELGASLEKHRILTEAISLGVFRMALDEHGAFVELNDAGRRILGLDGGAAEGFEGLLADPGAFGRMRKALRAEGAVKDMILQVRKADGGLGTLSLSAAVVPNAGEEPRLCDGVFEDVSERRRRDTERDNLIVQLQSSLLFLSEPVRNSLSSVPLCPMTATVAEVAALMRDHESSAAALTTGAGEVAGLVTDHDLRERVVAAGCDPARPAFEIMSSPVFSIPDWAPIYEAFLRMRENEVRHLVVKAADGKSLGVVRRKDLIRLDRYSAVVLADEIRRAESVAELRRCRERLPALVGSLADSGAPPRNVGRIMAAVSDAVVERVAALALEAMGPAPARFCFVAFGGEGREEQTLASDQDNALLYEAPQRERTEETAEWFRGFGERICAALDEIGYTFCPGGMMARNPKWNMPLEVWKRVFKVWIAEPDAEELLRFNILFDFRPVFGDPALARDLRRHIHETLQAQPAFFQHLARNLLRYKPPLGLFGQIVTGAGGAERDTFNVKDAMLPIVNFARLYALQTGLEETNTLDRINRLREAGVLRDDAHRELTQAYERLMELRIRRQVAALREGRKPDNAVSPKALSQIEIGMIKQAFSQISMVQKRVSFDFLGAA